MNKDMNQPADRAPGNDNKHGALELTSVVESYKAHREMEASMSESNESDAMDLGSDVNEIAWTAPVPFDATGNLDFPDFPLHLVPEKMAAIANDLGRAFNVRVEAVVMMQTYLFAVAVGKDWLIQTRAGKFMTLDVFVHLYQLKEGPVANLLQVMLATLRESMEFVQSAFGSPHQGAFPASLSKEFKHGERRKTRIPTRPPPTTNCAPSNPGRLVNCLVHWTRRNRWRPRR